MVIQHVMTTALAPPPIELRFVKTVGEMDAARELMDPDRPLLLVLKAAWCERCPAFGEAVAELATKYQFDYYYTDAADTELVEHYAVTKLPAFVLYKGPEAKPTVSSPATPLQVRGAVEGCCSPVLRLDAEF